VRFKDHDPLFSGPWLKWGQAVIHAQTLEADVETFAAKAYDEPLLTHRTEYHPKRHGFAVLIDAVLVPTPVRWGLLLGDVANNYRTALDQLAWALVTRGRTPPEALTDKRRRNIYFPIKETREAFNASINGNLPGVRRADIAVVRSYQPYIRRRRGGHHNLVVLAQINSADKHRAIQPVLDTPEFARYQVTHVEDCVLSNLPAVAERAPLEVDAEIALIKVRRTGPNPHIEVEPQVIAQPALEHNVWLKEWLDKTCRFTFLLLYEFCGPPSELLTIGIDLDRLDLSPD
jgi:hypothetical protein